MNQLDGLPSLKNKTLNIPDKMFTDVFLEQNQILQVLGFPTVGEEYEVVADNELPVRHIGQDDRWAGYCDWQNKIIKLHFSRHLNPVVERKHMMGGIGIYALDTTKAYVKAAYSHETGHAATQRGNHAHDFVRSLERHSVVQQQLDEDKKPRVVLVKTAIKQTIRQITGGHHAK